VSLSDLIEIVPLTKPIEAEITVPGSKSITNRALVLAALGDGETTLRGALWSDDTQVMVEGLRGLGFKVTVASDPLETCNRTIAVQGLGGRISPGGSLESPLEIFVGNAGTAARFLTAVACLGQGTYRIRGVKRMHERPQEALFDALRELGYCIDSVNDKLPATIHGGGPKRGVPCCVSIAESSQFASALLLCAKVGGWHVNVVGENAEESPYVSMTAQLVEMFPKRGGEFLIEPDASSGSYFWAAGIEKFSGRTVEQSEAMAGDTSIPRVTVRDWPESEWQIDARFRAWMRRFAFESVCCGVYTPEFMVEKFGQNWREKTAILEKEGWERITTSRQFDLADSIMTAIVLAPFAVLPASFTDLGRLRLQECERVLALRNELTRGGARVVEKNDTLTVYPSSLHGAEIETYNDHRMAMCFSILGLKVPGIKIKNPVCVKKTFPNFFQKLAGPPPHGLGATILDPRTGRRLGVEDLFAG